MSRLFSIGWDDLDEVNDYLGKLQCLEKYIGKILPVCWII